MSHAQENRGKRAKVCLGRLAVALGVALTIGYVPYHLYGSSGLERYLRLQAERDLLHERNLALLRTNEQLRAELDSLTDAERPSELGRKAIERTARDELGLVKSGEIVFQFRKGADR
jgi:cell division protein FtsB